MYCPRCGTQNADNAKFCVKCGIELSNIQPQGASPAKSQLAGMACHYPGCTEPVIGQCPGYKGACLRFYCAVHSVEPYCSVCAEKIARDVAIEAVYQDYLQAAKTVWSKRIGCGVLFALWLLVVFPLSAMATMVATEDTYFVGCQALGIIGLIALWAYGQMNQQKALNAASEGRPGFKEFYAKYVEQRTSETMEKVLTGLLVAGAAAKAIDDYLMRQDIKEAVRKKMKA